MARFDFGVLLQFHAALCSHKWQFQLNVVSLVLRVLHRMNFFLKVDVGLGFMLTNGRLMYESVSNTETQDVSVQIGPSSVQIKSDPVQKPPLLITPLCHHRGSYHFCSGFLNRMRLQTNISRRHCPFSPVITAPLSHIRSHQRKAIWSRAECSHLFENVSEISRVCYASRTKSRLLSRARRAPSLCRAESVESTMWLQHVEVKEKPSQ